MEPVLELGSGRCLSSSSLSGESESSKYSISSSFTSSLKIFQIIQIKLGHSERRLKCEEEAGVRVRMRTSECIGWKRKNEESLRRR